MELKNLAVGNLEKPISKSKATFLDRIMFQQSAILIRRKVLVLPLFKEVRGLDSCAEILQFRKFEKNLFALDTKAVPRWLRLSKTACLLKIVERIAVNVDKI